MQGDNPLRDGLLYFNPRSHKGSDEDGSSLTAVTIGISIHAPTRGATGCPGMLPVCWCISIHAPTRGATGLCGWNPRIDTISIHAPTRGATLYNLIHVPTMAFQSTLPQGERLSPSLNLANFQDFNPRSHKGSDIVQSVLKTTKAEFQSTLPQGERRQPWPERLQRETISIHAPTRGATQLPPGSHPGIKHFNPRSHKGSDYDLFSGVLSSGNFNPRSHKGSDNYYRSLCLPHLYFNPRSHKGSDQGEPSGQRKKVISIHAPTRGATKKDVQEGLK